MPSVGALLCIGLLMTAGRSQDDFRWEHFNPRDPFSEQPQTPPPVQEAPAKSTRHFHHNKTPKQSGKSRNESDRKLARMKSDRERETNLPVCQPPVLSYFNIRILQNQKERTADVRELSFCRANTSTCCTFKDFKRIQRTFLKGARKYNRMMEFVEETLTLFKGPAFWKGFAKLAREQNKDCLGQQRMEQQMFEGKELGKDDKTPIERLLSDPRILKREAREIDILLEDFHNYSRTTFYFFANIICTICDPFQNAKFQIEKSKLSLSPATCSQIIQNRSFELRLAKSFMNFIFPVSNYISCLEQEKSAFVASMVRTLLTKTRVEELESKFGDCLYDINRANGICGQLCGRALAKFSFEHFSVTDVKSALKTLFQFVNRSPIDDFYERVKKESFENILDEEGEVEFFERANINHAEGIMDTLHITLDYSGANPFLSYMTKSFWN